MEEKYDNRTVFEIKKSSEEGEMKNGGVPLTEEEIQEADIAIESVEELPLDIVGTM